MYSPAMNSQRTPKQFALSVVSVLAITLFAAIAPLAQQLQKGISVEMAPSHNAQPVPAADSLNAWIVTVTADGQLWFGTNSVTRDGLVSEMLRTPRNRDQNLYIKAEARVPYAGVVSALKAAHTAEFDAPVLLTAQPESREPGTMVPPQGLEIWIGSEAATGRKPVLVEVLSAKPDSPTLRVNGQAISRDGLQNTMEQLFQGRGEKTVLLRADGAVSFAQVVHVIDTCRSTGAKVVLPEPEI
jgi:biopolymer transport protein ExbD